jgi:hypothetical protein
VQCLCAAAPLAAYLLTAPHTRCERLDFCALCALQSHVAASAAATAPAAPASSSSSSSSSDGDDTPAAPPPPPPSLMPLVRNIKRLGAQFVPGRQEDAHDFVHALLDACHVALLDALGGEARYDGATAATSAVYHLFGGATRSTVRCGRCRGVSATHETFLTLPLEVSGRISSVEEALAANFTGGEELRGGNAYACDACGALTHARKCARLAAAPNILLLALKRYTGGLFGKLNKRVAFGASLELGRFMARTPAASAASAESASAAAPLAPRTPPLAPSADAAAGAAGAADAAAPAGAAEHTSPSSASASASASPLPPPPPPPSASYRLFAVLVHLDWALSTSAGHYVCYVRRGGAWWKCDDANVTLSNETAALSQNAYMLFYQAAAPRPPPAVRPPGQADSAEEAAEEARRCAAAAAAAARAEAARAATEEVPLHTLLSFGQQAAPAARRDGAREAARTWPERLELRVALPRVARAAALDGRISLEGQAFELHIPGLYRQVSHLPFPVADTYEGTFDIDTRELLLKLAVVCVPRDVPAAAAAAVETPPAPPPPVPAGGRARGGVGAGAGSAAAAAAAAASARADATGASDSDDDDDDSSGGGDTSALDTHPLPKAMAGLRVASPPMSV